jgi:diacylglycerol kinase family enzyme
VSAGSATIEVPPRAEASANGARARERAPKKRMLIIVNPYATTVSDRLKNLVVYALQGRYEVEAVSTEAQHHAIEIGREACEGGYDVVVAFGGDGTLNEVANGLAGTDVPVTVLPGGSTNVVCRTLGIPNDVVDATEHLLSLADDFRPRKIDLGRADGRYFVFACGAGLDATAAKRVDSHPRLKARGGRWYYTWAVVSGFARDYVREPVVMRVETPIGAAEGVTAIAQNSDPFTYFGRQEIRVCQGAALDNGTLSVAMLRRAAVRDMPTLAARALVERLRMPHHRQVEHFEGITEAHIASVSTQPDGSPRQFPIQMDGDYVGHYGALDVGIQPAALTIVA